MFLECKKQRTSNFEICGRVCLTSLSTITWGDTQDVTIKAVHFWICQMRPLVTPIYPSCSPFKLIFCVLVNPIMFTLSLPPLVIQTDAVTGQPAKGTMDVFYKNDGSKHYSTYNLRLPWGFEASFEDITFAKISLGSNLGDLTANTATSFQIPLITDAKVALQRPCSSSLLFNCSYSTYSFYTGTI